MKGDDEVLGPCSYGLIKRFALPCHHILERAFDQRIPIPITLTHPYPPPVGGIMGLLKTKLIGALVMAMNLMRLSLGYSWRKIALFASTNQLVVDRDTPDHEERGLLDARTLTLTLQKKPE